MSSSIRSAAFSAIMTVGAIVLPDGIYGMTEASTTRRFTIPFTLKISNIINTWICSHCASNFASKSASNFATKWVQCILYGAIHIAHRQTSKELITDANLLTQCELTLSACIRFYFYCYSERIVRACEHFSRDGGVTN